MQKAILNTEFHGVPVGTVVVVVGQYTDIQGTDILVVEREDGQLLPTAWGDDKRTNIAAEFVELVATVPPCKVTRNQYDAMATLNDRIGGEAHVFTSQYDWNVSPEFKKIARGYITNAVLRSLEKRGFIRIIDTYWKGCTVLVLRGLPDDVEVTK